MCKFRHKVRNCYFYPIKVQISSISKLFFSNSSFDFNFRISKKYSFNPSLKNTLWLYIFESLRHETKILFEKSEFNSENFTCYLLSSVAINVNVRARKLTFLEDVHLPPHVTYHVS